MSSDQTVTDGRDVKCALLVNGAIVIPYFTIDNTTNNDPVATLQDKLDKHGPVKVNKGDLVQIAIVRGAIAGGTKVANTGTHVKMGITSTLTPERRMSTNLTITDAFAVNLTVTPIDPKATTAVGAFVDGVEIPGEKQADGSWKIVLKKDIKIFELTHDRSAEDDLTVENMAEGTTIHYGLYERSGTTYTQADSICTRDLLYWYIDKGDETTAALATAIRNLACAIWKEYWPLVGLTGDRGYDIPNGIKARATGIKGPTDSLYNLKKPEVVKRLEEFYKIDITEKTKFYDNTGKEILTTDAESYYNPAASETNLWLQAYRDYILHGDGGYEHDTIPGNSYRIYVALDGGDFASSTPYLFPYYHRYSLNDTQKAIIGHKYFKYEEDGSTTELTNDMVKDVGTYAYKIVGASVNLGDKISLVLLANGNDTNATEDLSAFYNKGYKLKITVNGKDTYRDFRMTEYKGAKYAGVIVDVPIAYYNDALDMVIVQKVDGDYKEVSAHLQYNVLTWCAKKYVFDSNYTLRGIYKLGVAADEYVKAHS